MKKESIKKLKSDNLNKKDGGFEIMRNKERGITYILLFGIVGFFIVYLIADKQFAFIGGIIGGLIGYFLSQRR